MMKKLTFLGLAAALFSAVACTSHYWLTDVSRERIVIDSRYDRMPDAEAAAFLAPYKHVVDSIMGPVQGTVAHNMTSGKPESDLPNLLADILLWAGEKYGEKPAFAVQNIGGVRADLTKGEVTYGDILAVAPFENKICFLTLTGRKVTELFQQIAGDRSRRPLAHCHHRLSGTGQRRADSLPERYRCARSQGRQRQHALHHHGLFPRTARQGRGHRLEGRRTREDER